MTRLTAARRRTDALTAARRLIVDRGIEAASVRNVAEEAGMSAGSLRHIFPSHDDLFIALLEDAEATTRARIAEVDRRTLAAREAGRSVDFRQVALELLMQIEPFGGGGGTGGTRSELLAQLAVLTANPGNGRLARIRRQTGEAIDGLCADVVRGLAAASGVSVDVAAGALELRLLVDGIALRALENPDFGEADASRILAGALDRLAPRR
ncbi:TetR/AcrR family transcriptional regulator [Corynebacterium nuruki]|nr:helix-turn-helix domain-containing protein [Corynebacterium nuruki]